MQYTLHYYWWRSITLFTFQSWISIRNSSGMHSRGSLYQKNWKIKFEVRLVCQNHLTYLSVWLYVDGVSTAPHNKAGLKNETKLTDPNDTCVVIISESDQSRTEVFEYLESMVANRRAIVQGFPKCGSAISRTSPFLPRSLTIPSHVLLGRPTRWTPRGSEFHWMA